MYKHTQTGYVMLVTMLCVALLFAFLSLGNELPSFAKVVMASVIFIIASFTSLTVAVDDTKIRLHFGYGIFRKSISLANIASVKKVTNKWYYGFGIRFWFWPKMWIYNVSGLDAVELMLKNGKRIRIGTDEPHKLETIIKQAL